MKKKSKSTRKKSRRSPARSSALTVDRRMLARLLGCSTRHVTELEAEGVIVPLQRGRGGRPSTYALEAAVPAYLRRLTEAPGSGAEREARRRRDMAQARLTELRIAREEGELVSREDIVRAGQSFVFGWKAKLRALPRRAVHAGAIEREQERSLGDFIDEILTEISEWKSMTDARKSEPGRAQKERVR